MPVMCAKRSADTLLCASASARSAFSSASRTADACMLPNAPAVQYTKQVNVASHVRVRSSLCMASAHPSARSVAIAKSTAASD